MCLRKIRFRTLNLDFAVRRKVSIKIILTLYTKMNSTLGVGMHEKVVKYCKDWYSKANAFFAAECAHSFVVLLLVRSDSAMDHFVTFSKIFAVPNYLRFFNVLYLRYRLWHFHLVQNPLKLWCSRIALQQKKFMYCTYGTPWFCTDMF